MKYAIHFLMLCFAFYAPIFAQGSDEFQVSPEGIYVWGARICSLVGGKFVVCWQVPFDDHDEIYGQLFYANGSKVAEPFLVTEDLQVYCKPVIQSLSNGGFIICWHSWKDDAVSTISIGIFAELYDDFGNKIGSGFQITDAADNLDKPAITSLTNGDFVVFWLQYMEGFCVRINGQIFNASGSKKYAQFQIDAPPECFLDLPALTPLSNDDFALLWFRVTGDGSSDIYAQIFNKFANKIGAEFQVNTITKIYNWYNMDFLPVASLRDRRLFVCWQSDIGNDKSWDIIGQQLNAAGAKIGDEFTINTYTQDSQCYPCIASLTNGWSFVCWSSMGQVGNGSQLFGQLYDALGVKIGNEFRIDSGRDTWIMYPVVAPQPNGGFVIVWNVNGTINGICYKPNVHQLQPFSLLFPYHDETLDSPRIRFLWHQPSAIRECYPWELIFDLYIDTDSNFPNPQIIKNIEDTTYTIDSVATGKTYFWKVLAKNLAGDSLWSTQQDWGFFIKPGATLVEDSENELPQHFELLQNYPNPFNSSTEIKYSLPQSKSSYHVTLRIYDIRGRLVNTLVNQNQAVGMYSVNWSGKDMIGNSVSSGVYFYTLQVGDFKGTRKMLLLE